MSDKYQKAIAACNVTDDDAQVKAAVEKIIAAHLEENKNQDNVKVTDKLNGFKPKTYDDKNQEME